MEIDGKVAIVSGGASGMGRAVAEHLARLGARVAILDRNVAQGRLVAQAIGPSAQFFDTDVTSEDSVMSGIEAAATAWGDIHISCTFAGVAPVRKTLGRQGLLSMQDFNSLLAVNLSGTFDVARRCADRMARNAPIDEDGARGVIIMVASIAAFQGPAGATAYTASKAGIVGMTLPLARDLAPFGIRVNTIAPGLILTPMTLGDTPPMRRLQRRGRASPCRMSFSRNALAGWMRLRTSPGFLSRTTMSTQNASGSTGQSGSDARRPPGACARRHEKPASRRLRATPADAP